MTAHTSELDQPAPGVVRLGDATVNYYLVESPDGVVLVDSGLPGHVTQLEAHLGSTGRSLGDITAVLLTHAHPDHTGSAAAAESAGAEIWIQQHDLAALLGGPRAAMRESKPERRLPPYLLRRPAALGTIVHIARLGGFGGTPVGDARAFSLGDAGERRLVEVPGAPLAIALPGHTPGSVGYLFADRGLLFTGDALVTHDGITGRTGPGIVSRAFTHDSRSAMETLAKLELLDAEILLPGHGLPFRGSPSSAAALARQSGPR